MMQMLFSTDLQNLHWQWQIHCNLRKVKVLLTSVVSERISSKTTISHSK